MQKSEKHVVFHIKNVNLMFLFPVCFSCIFRHKTILIFGYLRKKNWQDFKKKTMVVVGACIILAVVAQTLPQFSGF